MEKLDRLDDLKRRIDDRGDHVEDRRQPYPVDVTEEDYLALRDVLRFLHDLASLQRLQS